MAQAEESRHRLKHVEETANEASTIGKMKTGDVFVRSGTPCMRVETTVSPNVGLNWIVNLTNGKAWQASEKDVCHPAVDVELTFKTTRR